MKPERIQSPRRTSPRQDLSPSELDRYLRRAHCLRAVAFSRLIKNVTRSLRALFRGLKQARDRRIAITELRRLDQHALKDIGVERSQIPLIVAQLLVRRQADREPLKAYPLRSLVTPPAPDAVAEDEQRCPPLAA